MTLVTDAGTPRAHNPLVRLGRLESASSLKIRAGSERARGPASRCRLVKRTNRGLMTGYLRIPRALIVSGLALLGAGASLASAGDEGQDVAVRI